MRILYIGDIMGNLGIEIVSEILPGLREEKRIDVVIAQSENVTEGKGISPEDFARLQNVGVDFFSGGNWSLHREAIIPLLNDPSQAIIRPANYPEGTPGLGYKFLETPAGKLLGVSLLGNIVGRDADKPMQNPLRCIDEILKQAEDEKPVAIIVNFHGDFSSQKVVIGNYLDGRVTGVVGDHWHVPTADARILPKGTAHISDVGMCGALDASLGVRFDSVIPRWRDDHATRNILETEGPRQFNAVLIESNEKALASSIEQIRIIQ